MDPSVGESRNIQFRVHVKDAQPSEIEMLVQVRKADGTSDAAKSVKFPWPA